MSVVRVNKTKDFTVMSNYHLRDKNLSLKSKGLLSQMLSLPENWDYTIAGLAEINKENATAIKSALDELSKFGYLQVHKLLPNQTESGRYEYIYDIYEVPMLQENTNDTERYKTLVKDIKQEQEKQGIEILGVEFLGIENQAQLNTNIQNTDNQKTDNKNTRERKYTKKERPNSFESIISNHQFTDDVKVAINDFIQNRSEMKKPLTSIGLKKMLNKLEQLSSNPEEQIEIINQSIERNYLGVFPVKGNKIDNEQEIISALNQLTEFDINKYCHDKQYSHVNAAEFLGNYRKRNWKIGNAVVTDWHSAVDEWEAREAKKVQAKEDEERKIYYRSYMSRKLN